MILYCFEEEVVPSLAAFRVVAREEEHWYCVPTQLALHVTCCYYFESLPDDDAAAAVVAVAAGDWSILEATKVVFVESATQEVMSVNLAASHHGEHFFVSSCYYHEQPQFLPLFSLPPVK